MAPRYLILVLGLIALSILKKLQQTNVVTSPFAHRAGKKSLETLDRKRRDTEEEVSISSVEVEPVLSKAFMASYWKQEKFDVLSGFVDEVSESDNNITIIGWQRILDEDGNVKTINTIQLVIPPKPGDSSFSILDADDDDEDEDRALPLSMIKELREMFQPMDEMGVAASTTYEKFDRDGELEGLVYLDSDELYFSAEGFSIYNKSIKGATPEQVSAFIANIKSGVLGKPAILKYDTAGKLLLEQSKVQPYIWGNVVSSYEASDDILVEAPSIIAQISLQYPQEQIPKELALHYNKAYPKYKWRVLVSPSYNYLSKDVALEVSYHNFDLDEASDITYLIYGKKTESQ